MLVCKGGAAGGIGPSKKAMGVSMAIVLALLYLFGCDEPATTGKPFPTVSKGPVGRAVPNASDGEHIALGNRTGHKTIRPILAGSGSNIPITRHLFRSYAEHGPVAVGKAQDPSVGWGSNHANAMTWQFPDSIGSGGGIDALLEGAIDVAMISRPIRNEELAMGLVPIAYAKTPVCLIAHSDVPDGEISVTSLLEILKGTKTDWSDGQPIVVILREAGDSSNMVLESKVPGYKEALHDALRERRWRVAYQDGEMVRAVETIAGAFGVADLGTVRAMGAGLKVLALDGVRPDHRYMQESSNEHSNLRALQHLLVKELLFVTRGSPRGGTRRFIRWILESSPAHRVLDSYGYLPMPPAGLGSGLGGKPLTPQQGAQKP